MYCHAYGESANSTLSMQTLANLANFIAGDHCHRQNCQMVHIKGSATEHALGIINLSGLRCNNSTYHKKFWHKGTSAITFWQSWKSWRPHIVHWSKWSPANNGVTFLDTDWPCLKLTSFYTKQSTQLYIILYINFKSLITPFSIAYMLQSSFHTNFITTRESQ